MTDRLADRERLLNLGGIRLVEYTRDLEERVRVLEHDLVIARSAWYHRGCDRFHLEWPWVHWRRRRLARHLDEHGCAERGGFAYCDEAMRLFNRLPAKDKVLIG